MSNYTRMFPVCGRHSGPTAACTRSPLAWRYLSRNTKFVVFASFSETARNQATAVQSNCLSRRTKFCRNTATALICGIPSSASKGPGLGMSSGYPIRAMLALNFDQYSDLARPPNVGWMGRFDFPLTTFLLGIPGREEDV